MDFMIELDRVDRVYDRSRYLVLFVPKKYDAFTIGLDIGYY